MRARPPNSFFREDLKRTGVTLNVQSFWIAFNGVPTFVVFQVWVRNTCEFGVFVGGLAGLWAHRFVGAGILFSSFGLQGFQVWGIVGSFGTIVFNAPSLGLKCVRLRLVVCPPDRLGIRLRVHN